MSRTIQVNIRVTPEEHAQLLKCAGDAGLERGVFARRLVMEGLDRIAGGEPMVQRTLPGPGHLVAMDAMLNKAIMEVERFANKWAAHEAELLSLERKDQLAMHSARVVADWKAVSADSISATTSRTEVIVERRQERLEDRMLREPALERALDRALPERQLWIDEPGSGGPGRERDFGMDM